jgi:hypothetical protein
VRTVTPKGIRTQRTMHSPWQAFLSAIVGIGVLRKGAVVRTATGTIIDESGIILTANHNVDRLGHDDVIVVAVPSLLVPATTSAHDGVHIQLQVPALGTYPVDVNERVAPGSLKSFEKPRWVWTHAAVVVVETLHHEQDDPVGNQGLDLAILRITHCVHVRPGVNQLPETGVTSQRPGTAGSCGMVRVLLFLSVELILSNTESSALLTVCR